MIKKLVRQMLTAQILSALTVSLCLLIDNIMIGRFLGVTALAAYSLANPVLLIIGALGSMLSAGVQVACGRSLGRGSQEETNVGYSSAIAVAAAVSLAFMLVVLLLRGPLARLLGADADPALLKDTKDYMAGFIIGAPASMGALILVPFLQMAGQSGLLIAAVLGMTAADVGLDLASVLVFRGGMFGMGLASSLSYYAAMLIGGGYFLSRRCVFRFSFDRICWAKVRELLAGGVPTVFNMASSVVVTFVLNKLLILAGGDAAVAAYAVICAIGNTSNCISTGMGGVSLTLTGILFNEEDRTGLKQLLGLLVRRAAALGVIVTTLLVASAGLCVSLFIPQAGPSRTMAVHGLRLYVLGLTPCCVINALKYGHLGVGRVRTAEVISVLENAVVPSLAALGLLHAVGLDGIWLYFFSGEAITLAGMMACIWLARGGVTWRTEDILMLPESFGVPPEDLLERDIRDMAGVAEASRTAMAFCRAHGQDRRMGNRLALCIEEMAGNVVTYGFVPGRGNHLSLRLQYKNGRWVLRFRDDCNAFDPVSYARQGGEGMGIRRVMDMASEVRYTSSMDLNNLMLIFEA